MGKFSGSLFQGICLALGCICSFLTLYVSLYDLKTALVLCFLSSTFYHAVLKQVNDYLFSLVSLLHTAVSGYFYLEIATPLLERVRVEGHETYANWLEWGCTVITVLCGNVVPGLSEYILEAVFCFAMMACICVLHIGPMYGTAAALGLCIVKSWFTLVKMREYRNFAVLWGRLLLGVPLMGTLCYGLYAHYIRYLAVNSIAILAVLLNFAALQIRTLSSDNFLYLVLETYGKEEDIPSLRNKDIQAYIANYPLFPEALQTFILNWTLHYLHRMKGNRINLLLEYLHRLGTSQALLGLNKANCYFLQDCLLSHPDFPMLVLLYRYHYRYFRQWGQQHSPFLVRLRGVKALPDFKQARDIALMRELLEGAEAKLMLLWLIGKPNIGRVGRLPTPLLQDIVEYI